MSILDINRTYTDGDILLESDLDNIKTGIETFLNTTKLTYENFNDYSIIGSHLVNSSVTTALIDDYAITTNKLGTGVVTESKIGTGAITATKLGTGAVTEIKIPNSAITTAKIADSAITTAKIQNSAVTNSKLGTDLSNNKFADSAFTASKRNLTQKVSYHSGGGDLYTYTNSGSSLVTGINNTINTLTIPILESVYGSISSGATTSITRNVFVQAQPVEAKFTNPVKEAYIELEANATGSTHLYADLVFKKTYSFYGLGTYSTYSYQRVGLSDTSGFNSGHKIQFPLNLVHWDSVSSYTTHATTTFDLQLYALSGYTTVNIQNLEIAAVIL